MALTRTVCTLFRVRVQEPIGTLSKRDLLTKLRELPLLRDAVDLDRRRRTVAVALLSLCPATTVTVPGGFGGPGATTATSAASRRQELFGDAGALNALFGVVTPGDEQLRGAVVEVVLAAAADDSGDAQVCWLGPSQGRLT